MCRDESTHAVSGPIALALIWEAGRETRGAGSGADLAGATRSAVVHAVGCVCRHSVAGAPIGQAGVCSRAHGACMQASIKQTQTTPAVKAISHRAHDCGLLCLTASMRKDGKDQGTRSNHSLCHHHSNTPWCTPLPLRIVRRAQL